MKGCLKLTSPMPQGLDSEIQHLDNLNGGGAQCCHSPTTALSSGTATSAFSCTNTSTSTASTTQCQSQSQAHRKCVAFCAKGSETVYTADEWDRTPTEPARKLSYQDLLELKEIQRSLPHADQPPDIMTGRPGKQFLSGVPIVLLPLLGSGASTNGDAKDVGGAQEGEEKKPPSDSYFSNAHGRTNGNVNGNGWGPPSLTGFGRQARTQAQTTPVRPSFPFPPRPVPLSTPAPAPTSTLTSARVPAPPISPSPVTQPLRTSFQSQSKSGVPYTSPSLSSSYSNRPSPTSTSPTYPYSSRPPPIQTQAQNRMPWSPPPSLSHLMPSVPMKPREKPKFEFVTLLDSGAGSGGGSGPASATTPGGVNGVGDVEATITKVGPEVALQHTSKLPSGLIGIERLSEKDPHNEHDLEDHDQDHDLLSVTSSSSSCPSLCASSCPSSCSASEVDTDHEADNETEGQHSGLDRYGYAIRLRGNNDGADKHFLPTCTTTNSPSLRFPSLAGPDVLGEGKRDKVVMKKKPKLKKEKRFILVNDMEIELDDSESESEEEDSPVLSGRTGTGISISTTKEATAAKIEKTTTTASPPSPRSIAAPAPVKPSSWGSRPPPSPAPASLITPPTTPPSEHISRYGSHTNNSPTSSPSTANRGRKKGQIAGGTASRERSRSMCSDTSGGGGGGRSSPSRSTRRMESPVKLKR